MVILFGKYSYTIKRFNHDKVSIDGIQLRNLDFRLKMRVMHIMFIPIMGLEKFWVIKDKETGEIIEEVDERIHRKLNALKYETKPLSVVLGYTGIIVPILILTILLGGFIYREVGDKAGLMVKDIEFVSNMEAELENIEVGDIIYLKMMFLKQDEYSLKKKPMIGEKHQVALRIEEIRENDYVFKYLKVKQYSSEPLKKFEKEVLAKRSRLVVKKERILKAAEYGKPSKQQTTRVGVSRSVGGAGIKGISKNAIFYLMKVKRRNPNNVLLCDSFFCTNPVTIFIITCTSSR